jgi:hypothetical protein
MRKARLLVLLLLFVALGAALLEAQRGGRRFDNSSPGVISQKEDPTTEFAIARWYSSNWRSNGWNHDYPTAEQHILQIMHEASLIPTERMSYKIVDISSQEIFKYPFAYVSHPGEVFPSEEEIANIREYVERGGFMMLDDFGGQNNDWEMDGWMELLRRAFPGREMYELRDDHALLRLHYQIDNLQMEHPMSGAKSTFYGFNDSKGRLAMVVCWANDVGDFWEFIDEPRYKVKPSAEALKLGVNIVIYAMTH